MSELLRPDICVVGAGSAGLTVAAAAASFGVSVVLIEKDRMGGDCLNTGCVPSKALIAAARHAHSMRTGERFGVSAGEVAIDFAKTLAHVRGVIAAIAPNDSAERFTGLGVTVLRGAASFEDRRTVIVGAIRIRARRFVLATGSRPALPAIPNLETVAYLTNETLFQLRRRPAHLVVIGAGPIGLEMAQAFRRLGSEVTVLEAGAALAKEDPECAALLLETLRREGIDIREQSAVERVARRGRNGIRVKFSSCGGSESVDGTHLLIAAGRRPDVNGLGLEAAGIAFDAHGIKVNARLRTGNRRVYAIGDCAGGPQFTHWAGYGAGQVVRSILFRFGGRVNPDLLPWVTFTDPELAHVGLTEAAAAERRRGKIQVLRWPLSENDRAQAEGATWGLVKVLATRGGRILGADILAPNAGELIAPFALAVSQKLSVKAFAATVFPYPTMSESGRRAAIAFYAPKLNTPLVGRVIRLLRRLG
jgi:pyruvate/2-oxoglutarate dehydrogenase complex dihydrolipoamide dehydrogenase (E3) component